MKISDLFSTMWRRLAVATVIWVFFWPLFWFIRIGEIFGAKSWFWIIGELNYPIAALCFITIDGFLNQTRLLKWQVFLLSAIAVAAAMPYLYKRIGFSFAVLVEAILF